VTSATIAGRPASKAEKGTIESEANKIMLYLWGAYSRFVKPISVFNDANYVYVTFMVLGYTPTSTLTPPPTSCISIGGRCADAVACGPNCPSSGGGTCCAGAYDCGSGTCCCITAQAYIPTPIPTTLCSRCGYSDSSSLACSKPCPIGQNCTALSIACGSNKKCWKRQCSPPRRVVTPRIPILR
jgi:hypothetical protein